MSGFPNSQNNPAAAIPVYVTGGGGSGVPAGASPLGYQQITSLSSAEGLTMPAGATIALVQAEVESVRWRDDGTAPTASVGMLLAAGQQPFAFSGDLSALQFIAVSAGAVLDVSYYS